LNESDQQLVVRSQAGDRRAFEELVRRTGRLVYVRHYLATGDAHRSEDLSQETFLSAWRNISQVTDPSGFRAWLTTIARTVLLDASRRERRKKRSGGNSTDLALPTVAAGGPSPEASAEQSEYRERLLAVLNALPEEYRLPITLRYIAGADYETISQQLGLTNGSLRGLLNRGMAKLREAMEESS
jgi:RNA polymerase sigma-70 factor (ECF subfamily)